MKLLKRLERSLLARLLPFPVSARHAEYSMIVSADDDPGQPSPYLLRLAHEAIREAPLVSMASLVARMQQPPHFPEIWPGETYKLLAGLMRVLLPKRIVEIGTGGGTSTLTMKWFAPESTIASFDIMPWPQWEGTLLREEDFRDGRLTHHVEDLSHPTAFEARRELIESSDFLFIDAAKDGVMEAALLRLFQQAHFQQPTVLWFDDIRVWTMLATWRSIRHAKLDVTSFGHWTGTGWVEWPAT